MDYGQKHYVAEKRASILTSKLLDIPPTDLHNVGLTAFFNESKDWLLSEQAQRDMRIGRHHFSFVQGRNAAMILRAAMFASVRGINKVVIGANENDVIGGFPDCSLPFLEAMQVVLSTSFRDPIQLVAPCRGMMKTQTIAYILKIGARGEQLLENSWSCYEGKTTPCGSCGSCVVRQNAIQASRSPATLLNQDQ
jgi:7-cyano-7-deazaguanine synthase